MLRGSGLYDFAAGIAIAVILLFLCAALKDHYKHATGYQATTDHEYESRKKNVPLGGSLKAVETDPRAYRDEWRAEQDLEAQRQMADWAFWMLLATGVGVGVTAIGVGFVARTLSATQEMNNLVAASFSHEHRAWMMMKNIGHAMVCVKPQEIRIITTPEFVNIGNTPALNVVIEANIFHVDYIPNKGPPSKPFEICHAPNVVRQKGDIVFPGEPSPTFPSPVVRLQKKIDGQIPNRFLIKFTCRYFDGMSDKPRRVSYTYTFLSHVSSMSSSDLANEANFIVHSQLEEPNTREIQ